MLKIYKREDIHLNEILDDPVTFNLMSRILDEEALVIKSDDNKLLATQNIGKEMWLWLKDQNIKPYLNEFLSLIADKDVPRLTAYPKVIQEISASLTSEHEFGMGLIGYHCPKVKMPYRDDVKVIKANMTHLEFMMNCLKGFAKDSFDEEVTAESQRETAMKLVESDDLYLLMKEDVVVSTTYISHRSPIHGRINTVYTPDKHRKKGYASFLVATVSQIILDEGLVPVLYTDDANETSNKVYKSIGYIETGRLNKIVFI